ncbi:MAG: ribulose-phosphate 3-epimerase [Clostridia bacterium]|nr:ribulose-phosphate 3-epimerase [Clostridia bacterium]
MKKSTIAPSLMCADFTNIKQELSTMQQCGIEFLHIDIMDGVFVPNITLSSAVVKQFRKITSIPYDYHLMITNPEQKADMIDVKDGDLVSVHYESTPHVLKAVQVYKAKGAKVGIALNPATPINVLEYLLSEIDFVLIMTVNPGFSGQTMVPNALEKIADTRKFLDKRGYKNMPIEVDGNVSFDNAPKMRKSGADIFVAGTSSVYSKDADLEQNIINFRKLIK